MAAFQVVDIPVEIQPRQGPRVELACEHLVAERTPPAHQPIVDETGRSRPAAIHAPVVLPSPVTAL